jgi:glutathione S-transferase
MRLYYKPGACSLASRIVLTELELPYHATKVDTAAGKTETGTDYRSINPKGYVPALALDSGEVITEGAAILQYLADQRPGAQLAPGAGTLARVRLQEWLNFIASELHTAFGPYFSDRKLDGEEKGRADARLARRIDDVERDFADGRRFTLGEQFSVADAYLFVVLNWSRFIGLDLVRWPRVSAFVARVGERPAVQSALRAEGLLPAVAGAAGAAGAA